MSSRAALHPPNNPTAHASVPTADHQGLQNQDNASADFSAASHIEATEKIFFFLILPQRAASPSYNSWGAPEIHGSHLCSNFKFFTEPKVGIKAVQQFGELELGSVNSFMKKASQSRYHRQLVAAVDLAKAIIGILKSQTDNLLKKGTHNISNS